MRLEVDGAAVLATTGGRPLDIDLPLLVFLHGASQDRTLWSLQTRYFAHHGRSVLAPDLPGHGGSGGDPLPDVPAMAEWTGRLIESAGFDSAALVGHSMGALIALELAASRPDFVTRIALTGAAAALQVHPRLQDSADKDERRAHEMIMGWSLSGKSFRGGHPTPGLWMHGHLLQVSLNAPGAVLAGDLRACHRYEDGLAAATKLECPVLVIAGAEDRMVDRQSAQQLLGALGDRGSIVTIAGAGHSMMVEQPDATLDALIEFFAG